MSSETLNRSVNHASAPGSARYGKVLLIDDNTLDNFINKKILESNGFAETVTAFSSATDALAYLKKATASDLPDIIFLDINMPVMDGFQFLDAFNDLSEEHHTHCRVIMLSTSESFKDLNRANKNRFVKKFLNKPLTAQVVQAIKV